VRLLRGQVPASEPQLPWSGSLATKPKQQQRRLQLEEIDELARAYEAGTAVRQLAEDFDIHRETVRAHLDRAGITRRPGCTVKLDEAEELTACRLYEQGLSLKQVGAQLRVTDNTVLKALKKHGVQRRRPGRPPGRV
jgi:DNA-binding NarL/FixJ family response regulator